MHMPTKKIFLKKVKKQCFMGQIVIESHNWIIDRTVKSACPEGVKWHTMCGIVVNVFGSFFKTVFG